MKFVFLLSTILMMSQIAHGKLKSKYLRKMICIDLSSFSEHDFELRDLTDVRAFVKECISAESSLMVKDDDVIYNKLLKEVVGLNVVVNFESKSGYQVKGVARLRRTLMLDSKTENINIGKWSLLSNTKELLVKPDGLKRIIAVIIDRANFQDGEGNQSSYTNMDREVEKLKRAIKENNNQSSCKKHLVESEEDAYALIHEAEDGVDTSIAGALIDLLKKQGYINVLHALTVNERSQKCANQSIHIYLTDGTVINLYYDFRS